VKPASPLVLTLVLTLLLAGCDVPTTPPAHPASPNFAASATNTNFTVLLDRFEFVPCANGGAGEFVHLTGRLHVIIQVTLSAGRSALLYSHSQPEEVTGVGLTSGAVYHGTGVTKVSQTFGSQFPVTRTFVNSFNLIGPGPNNNFKVHQTIHITINANGTVTAFTDNFSVTCS